MFHVTFLCFISSKWYLEESLCFRKGRVPSDSISSSRQLLDHDILLMQKSHQMSTVARHPAVALRGPFAPIKLDSLLCHLVLLKHRKCANCAEAQEPACNLHPDSYVCLHVKEQSHSKRFGHWQIWSLRALVEGKCTYKLKNSSSTVL